jgi:Tol biopolymer transport system component
MRKLILAAAVIVAATSALPPTAAATFPAKNGRIAFKRFLDPALSTSAVFASDVNGRNERRLSHPPEGAEDNSPDWSADGLSVTFQRCRAIVRCEVWTVRADGTGETRLGPDCLDVPPGPLCESRISPAYSPSGAIVFGRGYVDAGGVPHADVDLMNAAGGDLRTILSVPPFSVANAAFAWAPDGARLVVEIVNSESATPPGGIALYVMNADGSGGLRQITPFALRGGDHPDWSPDGERILFRSNAQSTDAVGSQLHTVRPDGTGLEQLSHFSPGTRVLSSSYSPDGKWITVGLSGVDGNPDVYVMRTNGHGIHPVTRTSAWDSAPDWGPR